jgi:hypothetical protein
VSDSVSTTESIHIIGHDRSTDRWTTAGPRGRQEELSMAGNTRTQEEEFLLYLHHQLDAARAERTKKVQDLKDAHARIEGVRYWLDQAEKRVQFYEAVLAADAAPTAQEMFRRFREREAERAAAAAAIADAVELGQSPAEDPNGSGIDLGEEPPTAIHAPSHHQVQADEEDGFK